MIPWFIVNIVDWVAGLFGYQTYVRATSGNWWGAERLFITYNPEARRVPKLKARGAK